MILKKIWAISSLACGCGAIIVLIAKILVNGEIHEHNLIIKIFEILWGLSSLVYFGKEINNKVHKK